MNRIWEFRPTKLGGIIMVHHHAIMLTDPILDLWCRGILKITWGYVWLSNGFKLSIQCVLVKFACTIYKGIGATPTDFFQKKLGKTNGGHIKSSHSWSSLGPSLIRIHVLHLTALEAPGQSRPCRLDASCRSWQMLTVWICFTMTVCSESLRSYRSRFHCVFFWTRIRHAAAARKIFWRTSFRFTI